MCVLLIKVPIRKKSLEIYLMILVPGAELSSLANALVQSPLDNRAGWLFICYDTLTSCDRPPRSLPSSVGLIYCLVSEVPHQEKAEGVTNFFQLPRMSLDSLRPPPSKTALSHTLTQWDVRQILRNKVRLGKLNCTNQVDEIWTTRTTFSGNGFEILAVKKMGLLQWGRFFSFFFHFLKN